MPLYRKRFKQPLSQQQPKKEIISASFQQSSSSQQSSEQYFSKVHASMNSPDYPEVLPRTASEPNESAFADDEFGKIEIETTLPNSENYVETSIEVQSTTILRTPNSSEVSKIEGEGKNQELANLKIINENDLSNEDYISSNSSEVNKIEEKFVGGGKNQELANLKNINEGNFCHINEDISLPPAKVVDNLNTAEQNDIEESSNSQMKLIEVPKKKKRNADKPKPNRIKNKKINKCESEFSNTLESSGSLLGVLPKKIQYSRDLDTSLNSSKSSQISMNDTKVKEAYKHFLLEKKSVKSKEKIICTQNSDVSLNDPDVKEIYSQFMEKKDKFARINTPKGLTHYDKMKWLQKQRNVGVYVHCDRCDKIRYLDEINDPTLLPDKWYCEDSSDTQYNNCDIPQERFPLHVQEDWINNLYNAGSIVWGRVDGYPWWPGMVEDDPDTESYYWLEDEFNDTPTYYHVTFFDETEVTRAWLKPHEIKSFHKEKNNPHLLPDKHSIFRKRINFAIKQANEADDLSLQKRFEKYSFLVRYKKPIKKPREVQNKELKRKASKFNKSNFTQEKRRKDGEKVREKTKKKVSKHQKLERYDSFPTDFEIPPSPALENISLELFEDL